MYANCSSKILKEFTNLVTSGTHKISFMQFSSEQYMNDQNSASQATQRYENFIPKHLSQIRMPLVKSTTKVQRAEQAVDLIANSSGKQNRKVIIHYSQVAQQFRKEQQMRNEANAKVNASLLSRIPHAQDATDNMHGDVNETSISHLFNDEDLHCKTNQT